MSLWVRLVNYLGTLLWDLFPGRVRDIRVDGTLYLRRFYLKHNGRLPGVYLHHFYRSDPDRDLHNHPWSWSLSFILTGGYFEYRNDGLFKLGHIEPEIFDHRAPGINRLNGDTFHRVVLKDLKNGAWSIFVSGPDVKDWGFMTYKGFVPHQQYLGLERPFLDVAPNRERV